MRRCTLLAAVVLAACGTDAPAARMAGPPCPDPMAHLADLDVCIDRYERALVGEGAAARSVPARGRLPENEASWFDADRACRGAGLRLCTAEEWYRACSGSTDEAQGRAFPYGAEFEAGRCNSLADGVPSDTPGQPSTAEVPSALPSLAEGGAFEGCVTEEGVYDLTGNTFEWLATSDESGVLRQLRGGSYGTFERYAQCISDPVLHQPPDSAVPGRGFRCCRDSH